ncbi:PREDICTED: uncharacterized protein LOC104715119 [Camelina sativa]|uniref:Uncharacterized protein LOC104715119 n=1 Tax=Camelina sativa TaxID=90675 RepID=A0ABM0TT09_CAMSA|nr:PREDICTED: uncharacterized protein LOC104715119 [Camelina sativa]
MVISFVYAANDEATRQALWDELINISNDARLNDKAWALLGYFIQILHPEEHSADDGSLADSPTRLFREVMFNASLTDLNFRGPTFTWWNKRRRDPVTKKLDRILINDQWTTSFPSSLRLFGEPSFSDHASCGISFRSAAPKAKKPFRFFNFLLKDEDFIPLICLEWFSLNITGSTMFRVSNKLKALKKVIRDFSRENYSDLEKRTEEAHESLFQDQNRMLQSPSVANAEIELEKHRLWLILSTAEESYFLQRSRVTWLREGDSNTSYFHKMTSSRQAQNHIHFLLDGNGNRFESQQDIQNHCVDYFQKNLGGEQDNHIFHQEDITNLLNFRCSQAQQSRLESPFTAEEVKAAFSRCQGTRLVGLMAFPQNSLPGVAGRLKAILPSVISHAQSAFMLGRLLLENVLLATEIVQGYNKKATPPSAMLKVDLRKAFDSIRWDFLIATLKAVNLPEKFIGWIQECLTTASFSLTVNGHTGGFFKSTQGLRQGDAMSPYLFVLAMEVFSDDVMIFFDSNSSSLHGIYETLEDFAGWSGLHMNRDKTQLFHSVLSQADSNALTSYGFTTGMLPKKYMGLPLMSRKLKVAEYAPLIEKIKARFNSWATKSLSFADIVQLITSDISGIVNFWISTFILPLGCIRQIESLCSRFLWSGQIEKKGLAKISWSQVCLPKSEGGIGLRRFATWNRTLCLRMIWLLFSGSASLWVAWHKLHNCSKVLSLWDQPETASNSWNWKCLLRLRNLAEGFIKCTIGNGREASFWFDNWTPFGPLIKFIGYQGPRDLRVPRQAKVADVCDSNGWKLADPRSEQALQLHIHLTTTRNISEAHNTDSYEWVVDNKKCNGFSSPRT